MLMTVNPHYDAERHNDEIEAQGEAQEEFEIAEALRISNEFVSALPWGEDEPLEGATVGDALCDIACSAYAELLNQIVVAAGDSEDPALRKLVRQLGDGFADLMLERAR